MRKTAHRLGRGLLRLLDAETAHNAAGWMLAKNLVPKIPISKTDKLSQTIAGLHFANPIGLAAGFDKDARMMANLARMGFGFCEFGTVTPSPQAGKPRPRIFRQDQHIINRMGFPSVGMVNFQDNFLASKTNTQPVHGINIGANLNSDDRIADYVYLAQGLSPMADYLTVNVSSPNTEKLRDLQQPEQLHKIVTAIHNRINGATPCPIFIKLSPDLDVDHAKDIAQCLATLPIAGLILTNTTMQRPHEDNFMREAGGLSGPALTNISHQWVARFYGWLDGAVPIIGVGGIMNADDACNRIMAGASLIQLYSGLIVNGFALIGDCIKGLNQLMDEGGYCAMSDIIGKQAHKWRELP